jgi:hypothetical protein
MTRVRSHSYELYGDYKITEMNGKFYKFSNGSKEVYVPASNIDQVEGFIMGGAKSRRKKTNKRNRSRKNRA